MKDYEKLFSTSLKQSSIAKSLNESVTDKKEMIKLTMMMLESSEIQFKKFKKMYSNRINEDEKDVKLLDKLLGREPDMSTTAFDKLILLLIDYGNDNHWDLFRKLYKK